jgi:hypothetical protein
MAGGRILETGSSRELFLAPKTEFGARFFGAGLVFPCVVTGEAKKGWRIRSPLGKLLVPRGSTWDPERPLVFIPRDALSPAGGEKPPGTEARAGVNPVTISVLFKRGIFEGERMLWEVEIPGGFLFQAPAGLRTALPPENSPVKWRLDQGLTRFVLPSEPGGTSGKKPGKNGLEQADEGA